MLFSHLGPGQIAGSPRNLNAPRPSSAKTHAALWTEKLEHRSSGSYRAAASEMNRGCHGNYVDDWIGYSNDLTQLVDDFACFLAV
jgi:hypothetical protein